MRSPLVRAAALAALALAAEAGSIGGGFVLDDNVAIVDNPVVAGSLPARELITTDFWGLRGYAGTYRPLVAATFTLDWWLSGGTPRWLHAINVLLHACAVALAYLALRRPAGERVALAAAAFAAVFAASAEAVQSLVGRADLMLAALAFAGLLFHQRAGKLMAALASLSLLAGLCSKESALLFVPAWLAIDLLLPAEVSFGQRRARLAGYAAMVGLYAFLRQGALGSVLARTIEPVRNPLAAASFTEQVFGAARVLVRHYLAGFGDPTLRLYLCSAPECGVSGPGDPIAWLGLAAVALSLVAAFVLATRVPAASAGLLWFGLFFLPASNLIVAGPTIYAERTLYLPAFGLGLLLGGLSHALARRTGTALAWGPLVALGLGNAAAVQLRHPDWRSTDALFESGLAIAPGSAVVQLNAAIAAYHRGDVAQTKERALAALSLSARLPEPLALLALIAEQEGDLAAAEAGFLRSLAVAPLWSIRFDYAKFLARRKRPAEAAQQVELALRSRPGSPDLRRHLALYRKAAAAPRPPAN